MKNIKFLSLMVLLSVGAIFLTNCGTGTDEGPAPKPTLDFLGGASYVDEDASFTSGTEFTMAITATHSSNIKSFTVTKEVNGGAAEILVDSTMSTKSISKFEVTDTTEAIAGNEVYTFTVSDKDGNSTSKSITITNLGDGSKDLAVIVKDNDDATIKVYNFKGPKQGAYEIGQGPLSSSDPDSGKDIQDSTATSETSSWPARWTSRNGTTFKLVSSSAWNTITNDLEIKAAWDAAGTAESVINVTDGDSYILNIKNSGKYALVTVTDVVTTSGDNNDYVEFMYKYEQ
ncbi:hypothetical protein OAD66_04285 [Bacteroidia bacterium]|nr:hypothetical protein [Bacteroidia bacterium]